MRGGQRFRVLRGADDALRFSFERGAVFRMGYDAHVREWRRLAQQDLWQRYHTDPAFAAHHDAQVHASRNAPMPEWKADV